MPLRLFRRQPADGHTVAPARRPWQVHRGTLRSELDEPAELHPAFAEMATAIDALRRRYEDGEITRLEFAVALNDAKVAQPDGSVWTVGASTQQWYRRFPGSGRWEPALPPEVHDGQPELPPPPADAGLSAWLAGTAPLPPAAGTAAAPTSADPAAPTGRASAAPPLPAPVGPSAVAGVWTAALRAAPTSADEGEAATTAELAGLLADPPPGTPSGGPQPSPDVDLPPELLVPDPTRPPTGPTG